MLGPQVNDEYGDVYSVLYMLTADGLGLDRLKDFGEDIRQQLLGVPGVNKVDLIGTQGERIFVEFSHVKLATLGISPQAIFDEPGAAERGRRRPAPSRPARPRSRSGSPARSTASPRSRRCRWRSATGCSGSATSRR